MANPNIAWSDFNSNIKTLITTLQNLQTITAKIADDSTLAAAMAAAANAQAWPNITAQDIINAGAGNGAVGQILFAFNSGNPTQASLLYKLT